MEDLDTWLEIIGIRKQKTELGREEDWNMVAMGIMDKGGLKEEMDRTI